MPVIPLLREDDNLQRKGGVRRRLRNDGSKQRVLPADDTAWVPLLLSYASLHIRPTSVSVCRRNCGQIEVAIARSTSRRRVPDLWVG